MMPFSPAPASDKIAIRVGHELAHLDVARERAV
jgi:hypothetical protein